MWSDIVRDEYFASYNKQEAILFTYNECKIISAVPIAEIKAYMRELGAVETDGHNYVYNGLKIEITAYKGDAYPDLGIPRHTIVVHGDKAAAENYLTAFRFRFLSAGG
jgi:hypothetical protein